MKIITTRGIKKSLDEIGCLIPKKRKHIDFLKARWIYQLEDTDIYLIYLTEYSHESGNRFYWQDGKGKLRPYGWFWYRVNKNYHEEIKSIDRIDFYEVMDDVSVPTEILFHINELSLLKASDEKDVC